MTSRLTARYADALAYAAEIHADQDRKGPGAIPYISHLLAASSLVLEAGGTEDEAIAALLHDAAEDQGGQTRLDDIEKRFGANVASIVRECTDSLTDDPDGKAPWRERKKAHLEHLRGVSASALLVTAADKLHNARSLVVDLQQYGRSYLNHFNAEPRQIVWYYQQMYSALVANAAPPRLTNELGQCVLTLTELIETPHHRPVNTIHGDWIRSQSTSQYEAEFESIDFHHWRDTAEFSPEGDVTRGRAITAVEALQASGLPLAVQVWIAGDHWQITALTPTSGEFVAAFRSDDTWVTPDGIVGNWSGIKEGTPQTLGLLMARDYWRMHPRSESAFNRYARAMPNTRTLQGRGRP
jgi:hypothetical protein